MGDSVLQEINKSEQLSGFQQLKKFAFVYIKTMRLYYAFISGIAGWIGVAFYFGLKEMKFQQPIVGDDYLRGGAVLLILFSLWGINQIFDDWLGLSEDRINAPHRPMVNGDLNIRGALGLSAFLMVVTGIISFFFNPWSVIPLFVGFLLNFLYNYAKSFGLIANVVFGTMVANCTIYGFLASGPIITMPNFLSHSLSLISLVILMNALMLYYADFKDYEGDKAVGKRSFIVRHGINTARYVGVFAAFLPLILFLSIRHAGFFSFSFSPEFIYCAVMTLFLQIWTGLRFFRHSTGKRAYFSNATSFRACACGQVTLIAMFNGALAVYLFGTAYIFIGFLFGLHEDEKG